MELLSAHIASLRKGCDSILGNKITCIHRLLRALKWDVAEEINDQTTQDLYKALLNEIYLYSGIGMVYDPSVVIPGVTIPTNPSEGTTAFELVRTEADLLQDEYGSWYLPVISNGGFYLTAKFAMVSSNGVTLAGAHLDTNEVPNRIYGFANNEPQSIYVLLFKYSVIGDVVPEGALTLYGEVITIDDEYITLG